MFWGEGLKVDIALISGLSGLFSSFTYFRFLSGEPVGTELICDAETCGDWLSSLGGEEYVPVLCMVAGKDWPNRPGLPMLTSGEPAGRLTRLRERKAEN